jgi:hypothetical protein
MEKQKLTEKINSLKVSKNTKNAIIKIAEKEQIQIQQACRKLLTVAIKVYFEGEENGNDKISNFSY